MARSLRVRSLTRAFGTPEALAKTVESGLRSWARPISLSLACPVLAVRRLPPRPVALVRQPSLPRLLAFRRVGNGVVMVRVISPTPARLDRFLRRLCRDQSLAPADQVLPLRLDQRLPPLAVILRLEELQQGSLHLAVAQVLGDINGLLGKRVDAGVVHAGGNIERSGDEILDLVGPVAIAFEEQGQVDHGVQV